MIFVLTSNPAPTPDKLKSYLDKLPSASAQVFYLIFMMRKVIL